MKVLRNALLTKVIASISSILTKKNPVPCDGSAPGSAMPGIPCHFKILDLTLAKMAGSPGLAPIHDAIAAEPEFAYLGAIGPAIADFIPGSRAENGYLNIWAEVFSLIGNDMRVARGLYPIVRDVRDLLDQLIPIAAAEDKAALTGLQDQLGAITDVGNDLQAIFDQIPFIVLPIGAGIMADMRPAVNVGVNSAVPPSQFWELRNYLHWKKTGDFAKKLIEKALAAGDSRFLAYAYGYLVSFAANVAGSPFANSVIGGPYRTQWWRYRWVNNYIDAWVHGSYETGAAMAGDTPNPPYDDWRNLCSADLHKKIALDDHDPLDLMKRLYDAQPLSDNPVIPESFGQFWHDSFVETYNPPANVGGLVPASFNDAYLMTWLVLWFQTSSDGLGCNSIPPPEPSDDCGEEPSWVRPEASDSGGTVTVPAPPEPEIEGDPDVGKIISGIILALLGLGFLGSGNLVLGGVAIAEGIDQIVEGATEPDWKKLRCDLYWYDLYLFHALNALHEILSVTAFRHPQASDLDVDSTMSQFFPDFVDPYDSGKNVTKSRVDERFPAKPWSGGFNWMNRPTSLENDSTVGYRTVAYPTFFVDDAAANPLGNGEVRIGGVWPVRTENGAAGAKQIPVQFGNVVDNVIDLFTHIDEEFPNWNLDADRGLAYHTWKFLNDVYLDPVSIDHED